MIELITRLGIAADRPPALQKVKHVAAIKEIEIYPLSLLLPILLL